MTLSSAPAQDRLDAIARVHDLLSKSKRAHNFHLADYVGEVR